MIIFTESSSDMQNSKSYLKTLTIIHFALAVGQIIFAIIVFAHHQKTEMVVDPINDVMFIPFLVTLLMAFAVGPVIYKKLLSQVHGKSLTIKLNQFRAASIVKYALIEGPSLFGIVIYFLSGNFFYLLVSGLLIIYFLTLRPTKEKIEKGLNLDYKEKEQFERGTI